ncbi:MAG: type 4a pilus biogenesis protein PilO [Nitrospiraceae bacterium]
MQFFIQQLRQPYGPLLPWAALVGLMTVLFLAVHAWILGTVTAKRGQVEAEWTAARQRVVQHMEAKKVRQDLNKVLAVLPVERDFAPLALGVTEEAKRDRVTLPALSYRMEKTNVAMATKAVLQGSVSGQYEDLRRFIYNLETAEELLFIEDLDVVRATSRQPGGLTFNLRIATYLRGESAQAVAR